MAAVTLTGNYTENHDGTFCSALTNGDAYTINGGATLLIDSDVAWGSNQAYPGNITINNGRVVIDGTKIKSIYFTNPVGALPALNTILTGVLSNTTGQICYTGAMFKTRYNTGFFKIREQFGAFIDNEPIRAGAWSGNLSGNAQTGWIHFVGTEAAGFITARNGAVIVSGNWYDLGTSNGNAAQVFQHYCQEPVPVVWVERTSGSNIYDKYLNAGTRWPNIAISSGERGYWFRHSGNVGVGFSGNKNLLFGSNNLGFPARIPGSGCNIRVPNVHFGTTIAAAWANTGNSIIPATLASRYDFTTTSAGDISLNKCLGGGFYLNTSQAVNVDLESVGMFDNITATETANRLNIKDVGVGLYEANDNLPLTLSTIPAPVFLSGIRTAHRDVGNENSTVFTNCLNVCGDDIYLYGFRSNAAANLFLVTSCDSVNLTGLVLVGARASIVASNNVGLYNTSFHSEASGANTTALAQSLFEINTRSTNVTIDGLSGLEGNMGALTTYPRTAFANIANSSFINLRNWGHTGVGGYLDSRSNTTYIYSIATQTTDVNLNKIYCLNTVTNHHLDVNDCTRIKAVNVWGDTGDSNIILALNSQNKGCLCGVLPIGQTAVYGTHFYDVFDSNLSGKIGIFFNEKTTDSVSTDAYTTSGAAKFNSLGGLLLINSGTDSIDYTWPHFILGYSGFMNVSGRGFFSAGTNILDNRHIIYQYDLNTGLGFTNTFLPISGNLTGHRFSPTIGVKPKFRFIGNSGSYSNILNAFYVQGMTDVDTRMRAVYPVDSIATSLNITNLVTGTEVRVFNTATDLELGGVESSDTTFTYNYTWEGTDINAYIAVHSLGYVPIRYTNQILGRNGLNIETQQQLDRVYENL